MFHFKQFQSESVPSRSAVLSLGVKALLYCSPRTGQLRQDWESILSIAYFLLHFVYCILHMVYGTAHCTLHLKMGKFLRHFRNICTIKSFQMKKFERSDDSKLHPCIGCWWLLTATKIINQQKINHRFFHLLEFRQFRKKIQPPYFFWLKIKFSSSPRFIAQGFKKVFWGLLSNPDIQ